MRWETCWNHKQQGIIKINLNFDFLLIFFCQICCLQLRKELSSREMELSSRKLSIHGVGAMLSQTTFLSNIDYFKLDADLSAQEKM